MSGAFDLTSTYVHLDPDGAAEALEGFSWDPSWFGSYVERTADQGDGARLVGVERFEADWEVWEVHPNGHELVVCLRGRMVLHQEIDGRDETTVLEAGTAAINEPGVWHTADVPEPSTMLFITSGRGTEHRPR